MFTEIHKISHEILHEKFRIKLHVRLLRLLIDEDREYFQDMNIIQSILCVARYISMHNIYDYFLCLAIIRS